MPDNTHFEAVNEEMENMMSGFGKNNRRGFFSEAVSVFRAAVAASAAVESHRRPMKSDLDTLGIDRDAFNQVRL